MSQKQKKQHKPKMHQMVAVTARNTRPVPVPANITTMTEELRKLPSVESACRVIPSDTNYAREDMKEDRADEILETYEAEDIVKSELERFIEISKHFCSPLRRTASYICENVLVSYPTPFRFEYKRGGVTTQHIKFSNLTLEPVFVKLYKLIPDLEQMKYINLNLSRSKRIPPGLSFNLGFVYDDVEVKPCCNSKMVIVAHRKTTTPCYQICEIDLIIVPQKAKIVEN